MGKRRKVIVLTIIAAVIFAAAIRYIWASDNLSLDEIWSSNIAQGMQSPLGVFGIHHDNNNILNTLYLYFFGKGSWWPRYRLFSVVAGIFTVVIMGFIGFKKDFFTGVASLIFGAFSIPLINYAAEARGYSLAVFFGIAAFAVFLKYGEKTRFRYLLIFWLSVIAGFLSHPLFLYIYGTLGLLSLSDVLKDFKDAKRWKKLAFWHGIPLSFSACFYFGFIRNMEQGGSNFYGPGFGRFTDSIVPALSLPSGKILSTLAAVLVFASLAVWLCLIERRRGKYWLFYLVVVVIFPLMSFFTPFPFADFFSIRYIVFSLPFFYICLASMLSDLVGKKKIRTAVAISALIIFVVLSVSAIKEQIKSGHGDYLGALDYICKNTAGNDIFIASDHDFRNGLILEFYARYLNCGKNIRYLVSGKNSEVPEWFIMHSFDTGYTPFSGVQLTGVDRLYVLERSFRHSNIFSGMSWFIYHAG